MNRYLFHGYMVDAKKLSVHDKEGVNWDADTGSIDGAFYIRTTVGHENFVPGDWLVSTLDGASVRVRTKEQFEPFAVLQEEKSAESIQEAAGDNGRGAGVNVPGPSKPGDSDAVVRVADGKAEAVGKTGDARRRRAAQRRNGDTRRDESRPKSRTKKSRQTRARDRVRKGRRTLK